jgi:large subunit ribosomal protein L31
MKENIHPKYYDDAKVTCSCGSTFVIGAASPTLKVEVCRQCHPFFTGEQRIIDTAGQIERYRKRFKIKE